jgi:hypothetical protein
MTYKLVDWLTQIKLNTWHSGHVEGVGFVKSDNTDYFDNNGTGMVVDSDLHVCGITLAPHLSLIRHIDMGGSNIGKMREYRLWMAVRDVFSGNWEIRIYRLISRQNEGWIQAVDNSFKRKGNSWNATQISKMNPFNLKARGSYSIYGVELPKARRLRG